LENAGLTLENRLKGTKNAGPKNADIKSKVVPAKHWY